MKMARGLQSPMKSPKVWAVNFEKVLNRPSPPNTADISTAPFLDLQINTEEPSTEEIVQAALKMENGRASGSDKISAEMIKASLGACITLWIAFFACIWKSKKVLKNGEKEHSSSF